VRIGIRIRVAFAQISCWQFAFASHSHINLHLHFWLLSMIWNPKCIILSCLFQKKEENYWKHHYNAENQYKERFEIILVLWKWKKKTNSILHERAKCKNANWNANANAMQIGIRICINANCPNLSHRTLIRICIALPALLLMRDTAGNWLHWKKAFYLNMIQSCLQSERCSGMIQKSNCFYGIWSHDWWDIVKIPGSHWWRGVVPSRLGFGGSPY
jgi:hypothetical protein